MWSDALLDAILTTHLSPEWPERMRQALKELFGADKGRYRAEAEKRIRVRAPALHPDGVPFAALLHADNPDVGGYGGTSLAFFPITGGPNLITFVIGTNGLAPDDNILGRPGHARKVRALCSWLNGKYARRGLVAWAKQEPLRTDIALPNNIALQFVPYRSVFDKYGPLLYAIYAPGEDRSATAEALTAFLDLMFEERGELPLKKIFRSI